jgi:hypothetical protein
VSKTYRIEIAIDADGDSPAQAARRGWELMTQPDSLLPVCEVIDPDTGEKFEVDLQEETK